MNKRIEDNLLRHEGYFEGLEEGVAKNQREMIINMYKQDIELDVISKYTNLTIDEVKGIINEQKNN